MSSEMRELVQPVLAFVSRQPCRCMSIAQLGERDYCDRCQSTKNLRALIARTEAGADGEKGVNNPDWPLLDRVEFALRDAGFDYDEAFRIAHLAAHPQGASGDAEWREFTRDDLPPATHQTFIAPRGLVWCWVGHEVIDIVNKHAAAMQAKEAK